MQWLFNSNAWVVSQNTAFKLRVMVVGRFVEKFGAMGQKYCPGGKEPLIVAIKFAEAKGTALASKAYNVVRGACTFAITGQSSTTNANVRITYSRGFNTSLASNPATTLDNIDQAQSAVMSPHTHTKHTGKPYMQSV